MALGRLFKRVRSNHGRQSGHERVCSRNRKIAGLGRVACSKAPKFWGVPAWWRAWGVGREASRGRAAQPPSQASMAIFRMDVARRLHPERGDPPEHGGARTVALWARARQPLLEGEPISGLARSASLFDVANGMAVRADPQTVAFPNLDLTVHLFEIPQGEWSGFDISVSFGSDGLGLSSSILHDERGPIGITGQALTVRP